MKKEIVYTDKYALLIKDNISDNAGVIKDNFLAHLPLSDAPILKGVPLLPSFSWSQQDDVDTDMFYHKQVMNPYPTDSQSFTSYEKGYIEGYNKAKEKYKYTEEDMINFAIWYYKTQGLSESNIKYWGKDLFQVWKSLQQPSRPTHFECEISYLVPNEPKTTFNSQGQIELVGKYSNQ